jgi:hypothetical protein
VNKLRRLLDAAGRVARDPSIVDPLVASTGLSRENVLLGLSRHLETTATDAEIDALVRSVTPAARVHVILSPSVFVAPLRAIALGLAASDKVTVQPSRREPIFTAMLVKAHGDPSVSISHELPTEGAIHAYGRDETIAGIRASASVPVRGHATGIGVALVTGDFTRAAEALASDVVPFDQRGCLSPRVAFVVGDAPAFARVLFDALESQRGAVPRGWLSDDESRDFTRWAETVTFAGTLHRGASCAVGALDKVLVPPTGRHVLVVPLASAEDLARALGSTRRYVIAVGTDDARAVTLDHVRVSPLGSMQRPRLDGPVDRRPGNIGAGAGV